MLQEAIQKYPKLTATATLILAVIIGIIAWWNFVWQNPGRVFTDMLANNLAASSVTKSAARQAADGGVNQIVRLEMGNTNAADWLVMVKQSGSGVTTESIGTPTAGYVRYTHIEASSPSKKYNFSNVLNVWAQNDNKTASSLSDLFNQSLLDIRSAPVPPIANLPNSERQNILSFMASQHIFEPSYKTAKREKMNGRDAITYSVAVHMGPYVRMMQAFAHDLGLTSLDTINASQYSTLPPLTITMSVDRASHQLLQVSYKDLGFRQGYTDWGLSTPVNLPKTTITTTQLQQRVQNIK